MLPPGHFAVGYVCYSLYSRLAHREPPASAAVLALAVGTQFPDLIDKPLFYWFGLLTGRSLAHSLLVAVPACLCLLPLAAHYGRQREGVAFAVGWLAHLPGDAYDALLAGEYAEASFLLWPLHPVEPGTARSFAFHLEHHVPELEAIVREPVGVLLLTSFGHQLLALAVVLALWAVDGFPGPGSLRRGATEAVAGVRSRIVEG